MSLPPPAKTWAFLPNNRVSYVSLIDTSSRVMYGIKNFLVATMGYTVKYSCDGTTGPTSSSDHTDRWASAANVQTRASTSTAGPQSFIVLTNGLGVDIMLVFQGISDDIFKLSFSPSGSFTPASPSTQQPTAADEQITLSNTSVITNLGTLDRVWHVMASTDKTMFRAFVYRSDSLTYSFGVEVVNSTASPATNFVASTVGWSTNNQTLTSNNVGHALGTAAPNNQGVARINSLNCVLAGCGEAYAGSITNPIACDLTAGAMIVGTGYVSQTTNAAGKVGNRIDAWYVYNSTTPGQGDTFSGLTHVLFGTTVYPWDGITSPEIA